MGLTGTAVIGALAGFTVFLGLPVARLRGLSPGRQGFLNAIATGVLIFLLVEILSHANETVEAALSSLRRGQPAGFVLLAGVYVLGIGIGLLGLVRFNRAMRRRLERGREGPGAALARPPIAAPSQTLALMIAAGLGLHNLSEGLAIGQSAATGALSLTGVLAVGFGLHNVTEGFGVAAPMASDDPPTWGYIGTLGLVAGGPTLIGALIGHEVVADWAFVLFLSLAAGALIYVINEMLAVCRRLNRPTPLGGGLLLGFLLAFATELVLDLAGA
ncbi:MAG TPA: ZIP family metal transporter [Candidatus Dormibacteraeota bacterium]|nr:ZIP family metal transporter [Candidatus Dormibacteraeota bacterium]